jgi:hypothetical protein
MRITVMAIAFLLGIASTSANAVNVRGSRSCGLWVQYHQQQGGNPMGADAEEQWLVGYLSGLAVGLHQDFLQSDNASLFAWVDNYCKNNPLNYLDEAGIYLAQELIKRKKQ